MVAMLSTSFIIKKEEDIVNILEQYINPMYLDPRYIKVLKETVKSRPISKYLVLDNFFLESVLDQIIEEHQKLSFNEKADRTGVNGQWLPYDGALAGCKPDSLLGRLLYSKEWHEFLLDLVNLPQVPRKEEIKLRHHKEEAHGFWLHSDAGGGGGGRRDLVAITYFNKDWTVEDGGMLQLWRLDEGNLPETPTYTFQDALAGPMDFLNQPRIKARPAGVYPFGNDPHDLVLVEQILPVYNRIFICNFRDEPAFHSVTPSKGKVRQGFVQWLLEDNESS
jgi:hypothetical protein